MQQITRYCRIGAHEQIQVDFVCMFPDCKLTRFLCKKCLSIGNHKHQQSNQSHILDNKKLQSLYELLKDLINKNKTAQATENNQGFNIQTNPLKIIIEEIQNQVNLLKNMLDQIDQMYNNKLLNEFILNIKNNELNQFDENQLNMFIKYNIQKLLDGEIYKQIFDKSNQTIQNAVKIKDWCHYQQMDYGQLVQKITNAKHELVTFYQAEGEYQILTSAFSNDFQYVVSAGTDKELKIWNYEDSKLLQSIKFANWIYFIRFTDDSKYLYVGTLKYLVQFDVQNQFQETYRRSIHSEPIISIYCITNSIILTSSFDKTIVKTDVEFQQQLLLIQAHDGRINGLDYDNNHNFIASGSDDKSIKIWNGNDGQLIFEKQNAHKKEGKIYQVLFISNKNQFISLDTLNNIFIWNINYQANELIFLKQLNNDLFGSYSISLILDQQCITEISRQYLRILSIKGDHIKSYKHDIKEFTMFNIVQQQSMKAILIQGKKALQICKQELE